MSIPSDILTEDNDLNNSLSIRCYTCKYICIEISYLMLPKTIDYDGGTSSYDSVENKNSYN